ncbi:type I-C CRISPR-associated protein Cas7/Csd2 [Aquabacterium sp. A7-Y]|uniref:type I-C CRISPR-associated protein Cas7/Csd2 n=1 Tax=Aquabacterium sp. A7-Y TaxID=1349605 RepID=UPI00223D4FA4|nr:type I-C CRISPR-associated protein Cas7/Csd2 [Aquabacterium sp. A7-Y]MCW7540487.1 type I-C CRISPR-associated protein Cas7/Csd2 [Aquabacterium sp. A7-Y]
MSSNAPISHRYDFVLLFDVRDGNPNGDPDAGNLPRVDAETGHGLVTDVSLKRKVRNFVQLVKGAQPPYDIYIKEKAVLEKTHRAAYRAIGAEDELADDGKEGKKKRKGSADSVDKARQWICGNFFDVRTFGAVMSTGVNCGQVRGPVQLTFSRSIDPIVASEHSITRMAVATEAEAEKQDGDNRTMGRKHTVPYGLYRVHGFISAFLAKQTGFSEDDLELFFTALAQMFEHDRSAARGEMSTRGLYVFKHDSELGNAHAHALFERVSAQRKEGVDVARSFGDYLVNIETGQLPPGVELIRRVG